MFQLKACIILSLYRCMPRKADSPSLDLWKTGLTNHAGDDSLGEEEATVRLM